MMSMLGRNGAQARDTSPEDVDDSGVGGAGMNQMMNQMIRRATGRPVVIIATADDGDVLGDQVDAGANDADPGDIADMDMEAMMSNPRFADAAAMVKSDEPRQAVRMVLADPEPDMLAVQFACCVLADVLGAEPLDGPGYAPIATILSIGASPDPGARDAAALTLLQLDGPGDAHDAGTLMEADGPELEQLVNRIRGRAGLQPLAWADRATTLKK